MNAETRTIEAVLYGDRRFVVPVYQRPYVWEREKQWEPLWDDVEATALRLAEARMDGHEKGLDAAQADRAAAPHFLGAVVIEHSPTATGDVETRLVVDGQQRLTTIQLLLRGVLDAITSLEIEGPVKAKLRKALRNDPEVVQASELLKIVPRIAERIAFTRAMDAEGQPHEGESIFAAARSFFAGAAKAFLTDEEVPLDPYVTDQAVSPETQRGTLLVTTLLGLVKLVVIDLDDVDDAQVIFEALNARNTPLSATDLVKNLLFLRIAKDKDPEELYEQLWRRFDDHSDWWLDLVGTGHAQRARQDWLLGDWLIAQLSRPINVGRLYGEFRRWIDESGTQALGAMTTLSEYANAYESLNGRMPGATKGEREVYLRIERLNITAVTPLLLWLFVQPDQVLSAPERELALRAIDSYVIRRMAAKCQTRAYVQAFVEVLRAAQSAESHPGYALIDSLRSSPHGYEWPTDSELEQAFLAGRYYGPGGISQERLRLLLGAIDRRLQGAASKSEGMTIDYDQLTVEHVIPQTWKEHWPVIELDQTERLRQEEDRAQHINRIGNLTLTTGPLNSSMSNDPWVAKRTELQRHSKLELNARLLAYECFDERALTERGAWLAAQLAAVWPGPDDAVWDMNPNRS